MDILIVMMAILESRKLYQKFPEDIAVKLIENGVVIFLQFFDFIHMRLFVNYEGNT